MKACLYRTPIDDTQAYCDNRTDLIHDGIVTLAMCHTCPYGVEPLSDDPEQQAEQLVQHINRIDDYVPASKPCGGCGSHLQFVWSYWKGAAISDEIRFSVRSVETFFKGEARCVIVGDRPPWFTGRVIRQKRVPPGTLDRRYRDTLSKLWTMATHAAIDDEFCFMNDDFYFLKPFTAADIKVARAEPWYGGTANGWQQLKFNSMAALTAQGYSNHDYALHSPQYVEKAKLQDLFTQFNLHDNTLLFEILYGNTYRGEPERSRPFLARINKPMDIAEIRRTTRKSTVLNHTPAAWSEVMRQFMLQLTPIPAIVEDGTVQYVPGNNSSVPIQRPVETHRAVIIAQLLAANGVE